MFKRSLVLIAVLTVVACAKIETTTQTTDTAAATMTTAASSTATASAGQPQMITTGLQTPESVLYHVDQDVYLVSNINGQPTQADNNGFIAKVSPDTLQVTPFIEAGKNGVTLNAPKGMAIMKETLYVADLDTVRKFDDKSGAPKGEIKIPGATFLNDVATDGHSVYVTDSGMKAGAGGNFEGTGTDAVWQITDDKPKKIASGKDLNRPNGVDIVNGKIWVVTFAAKELYSIDNGKKTNAATLPQGSLDGLVDLADGSFLISSWESNSVFRGPAAGPFKEVITNVKSPADIGYDTKRHRVLVPHFMENSISIHDLQ